MTKTNFYRLPKEHPMRSMTQRVAGGMGVAVLLLVTGIAAGQDATPVAVPVTAQTNIQRGFAVHETVDLGGHIAGIVGSGAMYDTLVNIHTGPRVLGETLTLHAIPGSKHPILDSLTAFSNGFGGDPINFAKLDFSKGKLYEFTGNFRRDRQYFDYDLLANPNIPGGQSIPIGAAGSLGSFAWPQVRQSPVLFNTVRRMTDTTLTILPLSKITFVFGYSQNIFQGPSRSPGFSLAESHGITDILLEEFQRNSTDDFTGAIDWKPLQQTKFSFEEEVDHYKGDSYFILDPSSLNVQEPDGTRVSLGDYDSKTPYTSAYCNANSIATPGVVLVNASGSAGLPVVDPACDVYSSYLRRQPTRVIYPTEIFRFQSSSIKNIAMNGDVRYTKANSNLPNYYEKFQGLYGTTRTATFTGSATAKRDVVAADYGITWQATKALRFSDQVDFSDVHQPGTSNISAGITQNDPATAGNETIKYPGTLIAGAAITTNGSANGTPLPDYFGQKLVNNYATASYDLSRATFALTYRYGTHSIVQGAATGTGSSVININENGAMLNIAVRPTERWTANGSVEFLYADNAFTPVSPRQTKHYRFHTIYRAKTWASFGGSYLDTERHNNTNNTGVPAIDGPLQHEDHNRVASVSADLSPNEHYGFDFSYGYSDVYTSTNACYLGGSTSTIPGAATASGTICPGTGTNPYNAPEFGPTKDFMNAPTQFATASLSLIPTKSIQSSLGYTISAVSGNQLFNDAQAVNGSLRSAYQSPFVHVAWTIHPGWVWKADYNYYGYGEGGPSGAPLCSNSNPTATTPAPGIPCNSSSIKGPTGLTEPSSGLTAPRNFHANIVTLSMHYEF